MKVALVRCLETEEECGGNHCFQAMENKEGAFQEITTDIELVGVTSCGGCPGDKITEKIELIVSSGADAVVLGSCIKLGTPIGHSCPNFAQMIEQIKELDPAIEVIEWTHHEDWSDIIIDRIKTTNLTNLDRFFTKGIKL
ncbi:MAG: CGGC domain-containing protein [Bacillota bacterium]